MVTGKIGQWSIVKGHTLDADSLFIFLDDTDKEVSWRESMEKRQDAPHSHKSKHDSSSGEGPLCGKREIFPWEGIPWDTWEIAI